ncbi:MAG: hypothetical protein LH614_03140 [Pyrinomonadaceae bacterium]|nr:hypothetical protein [Pyrinomonadaceae bacterium]
MTTRWLTIKAIRNKNVALETIYAETRQNRQLFYEKGMPENYRHSFFVENILQAKATCRVPQLVIQKRQLNEGCA